MDDRPTPPTLCSQCNTRLGPRRIAISEHSSAVGHWTFCSWACAHELMIRFVGLASDDN